MIRACLTVQVVSEILTDLGIGKFTLKLNHRRLLDAMLDLAGVPPQKFRCPKPSDTLELQPSDTPLEIDGVLTSEGLGP